LRRGDAGKLRYRQQQNLDAAGQHQRQTQHPGEDWPVDKEA